MSPFCLLKYKTKSEILSILQKGINMILEVVTPDGQVGMWTEHVSCWPEGEELRYMAKVGFRFRLDEKTVLPKKLEQIRRMPK